MGITGNVSLSLATALQRSLDVATNNIANASTAGFKASRPIFESFVDDQQSGSSDAVSYVMDKGDYLDTTQGPLLPTGNPLDLAVSGDGWFSYETPNGIGYGRDGRLLVNAEGLLVTASGAPILDEGGSPITIPADSAQSIVVGKDGTIVGGNGVELGKIGVFRILDPDKLMPIGNGLYLLPPGVSAAAPAESAAVSQGFIEQSNVKPVVELTQLMEIQRAYERAVTLMNQANDLTKRAIERIARVV